jgi:hypothetical protein
MSQQAALQRPLSILLALLVILRMEGSGFSSNDADHGLMEIHPILEDFANVEPFSVTLFGHTVNNSRGGTLIKIKVQENEGKDVHGTFHETIIDWDAPSWPRLEHDETHFQTSVKVYLDFQQHDDSHDLHAAVDGETDMVAAIFAQRYPQGVFDDGNDCLSIHRSTSEKDYFNIDDDLHLGSEALERHLQPSNSSPSLRSSFPSLNFNELHFFSYSGCFLQEHNAGQFPTDEPKHNLTDGIEAGPLLLFEPSDNDCMESDPDSRHCGGGRCGILSHYNEFMTQTTQHIPGTSTVSWGPMNTICVLPESYEAKTILVVNKRPSIQASVEQWGKMLRNEHMGSPHRRIHDLDYTTKFLGYSTDNGAYYYYNKEQDHPFTHNMEETMTCVSQYAKALGIPYRYWLLDSWWYYKSNDKIRAVTDWTPRPDVFPHGLHALYNTTRLFVQAHNRMWARDNVYVDEYTFVKSDSRALSLPTEYRFWRDLFQNATDWGLVVYEQDWLNIQFERQSQAFTNATLMRHWLLQMGRAAQDSGIAIQYCMPLARHILQSVEIPAVTQVRASGDYYPRVDFQWNIGITSLLYKALDLRPSKDSAWSISEQPGNPYDGAKEAFPEFQAMILAMSTGPVAFSDKIEYSNTTLILRTCRQDGVLLQPSQPLIPIHDWFYQQTQATPSFTGHVQESVMKVNGLPPYRIILALNLTKDMYLDTMQLTRFDTNNMEWVVYDASLSSIVQAYPRIALRASTTMNLDDYQLYFVGPMIENWSLLGERHKFVPLSSSRFLSVEAGALSMRMVLEGSEGEVVEIVYVCRNEKSKEISIYSRNVTIPPSGLSDVVLERKTACLPFHDEVALRNS